MIEINVNINIASLFQSFNCYVTNKFLLLIANINKHIYSKNKKKSDIDHLNHVLLHDNSRFNSIWL